MRKLDRGVQDAIKSVGEYGCYALVLVRIAGLSQRTDYTAGQALDLIFNGISSGLIASDLTVRDGVSFLESVTNVKWAMRRSSVAPSQSPSSYVVDEWYNPRTGLTHFTLASPVAFDPLADSITETEGAARSYRVYMRV
jgi:hypothetical protein